MERGGQTQIAAGAVGSTQLGSNLNLGGTTSGAFSGNLTGSATSFTGALAGDLTGTQGATTIAAGGGATGINVFAAPGLTGSAGYVILSLF